MKFRAFTLVEIIVVVVLVSLIFAVVFFMASGRHYLQDVLRTETDEIIAELRNAQLASMFGASGSDYTVSFESTRLTVAPSGRVHELDGVTITAISLSSGGSSVTFGQHLGMPVEFGTITVSGPGSATRVITIAASGAISWSL